MLKNGNPADAMLLGHIISAIIGIPFIIMYPPSISVSSALIISYMGIFQIGLASLFFAYGLKRINAMQAMLITAVEPILNPVWVFAITGERPSFIAMIGGAIILSSVITSSVIGMRREVLIAKN